MRLGAAGYAKERNVCRIILKRSILGVTGRADKELRVFKIPLLVVIGNLYATSSFLTRSKAS